MRISALLFVGLAACANATPGSTTPIGLGSGSAGPGVKMGASGDVSLDIGPADINGVYFEPLALGVPGVPLVAAKRKMTIDKHRAELAKAKDPVVKQAEAAIIATMLYEKSKTESGDEQQKDLTDARQVVRDVAIAVGDKVDELTLQLLGSYELKLLDYPAAEKAWGQLVAMNPKAKEEPSNRAWWAYSLTVQGKHAEALDAIKGEAAPITDKTPELAYMAAWAKWRTGDNAGAWTALMSALKGWGNLGNHDALEFETLVIAGHSNLPMAQELKDLTPLIAGVDKTLFYRLEVDLALKAYVNGGRWADAIAMLDKALEVKADKVPLPQDKVTIRFEQADFSMRLDDPVASEKYAKLAIEALAACGTACSDKDKESIVEDVGTLAKLFYIVYATAHDDRYYQPAHDLYDLVIPLYATDAVREPAVKDKNELERWQKTYGMKDRGAAGTHDKSAIGALLSRHNQEVQACYEVRLSMNQKLTGSLVVNLESDQIGNIKGVSTEPKAGAADLSAVAGCVAERARTWHLPKTANGTGNHSTRVKLTYTLQPKKRS